MFQIRMTYPQKPDGTADAQCDCGMFKGSGRIIDVTENAKLHRDSHDGRE